MSVPTNSIVCLLDFIALFMPLKEITKHFLIMIITAWKVLCLLHAIYYYEVKGRGEQKGKSLKVWLKFHVDTPAKKYIWWNPTTFKAMGTLEWISVELEFYPVFRRRHVGPSSSPGFFWEGVESGNSKDTSTITGYSTGRNGKQLKSAWRSGYLIMQTPMLRPNLQMVNMTPAYIMRPQVVWPGCLKETPKNFLCQNFTCSLKILYDL